MNTQSFYRADLSGCWPKVLRYYAVNHAYYEMELHTHPEFEIMYAADGTCSVFVVESSGTYQEITLREGEYIFLDSGIPHRLSVERGSPCRVLNLEIALLPPERQFYLGQLTASQSFAKLAKSGSPFFTGSDLSGELHQAIVSLQKSLYSRPDSLECDFQIGLFFLELANQFGRTKRRTSGELIYVKRALAFLEENFDREIAVADVAEAAGTSKAHLQRLFKAETGDSIVDRILELRIGKAKYLLETSTLPVIDVAIGVGFNSRQHFSETFRKQVGCPPALYRKRKGNLRVWEGFDSAPEKAET